MVSDVLPKLLGRTKARALQVSFMQDQLNAWYGSAFIFRGDSHATSVAKVMNGGLNLGFKFNTGFLAGNIGASVLENIADSGGMQTGTGFQYYEQLVHRVPAYDIRGAFNLGGHVDLIAEYIFAATRFNPYDMSYNNAGAKPSAFDLELAVSFESLFDCERPVSIGVGYGKSYQALAMGIPLSRTSLVMNTSIWRNTLQSLEFRHDVQYAASAVATGAGNSSVPSQLGKSDNAVTAQFDYYF
jgi:hypothetical protein